MRRMLLPEEKIAKLIHDDKYELALEDMLKHAKHLEGGGSDTLYITLKIVQRVGEDDGGITLNIANDGYDVTNKTLTIGFLNTAPDKYDVSVGGLMYLIGTGWVTYISEQGLNANQISITSAYDFDAYAIKV